MKRILILHDLTVGSRRTNRDHVYNFAKYGKGNLYLFHAANAPQSEAMKEIAWDGVIVNYCFLGYRASNRYETLKSEWAWIADLDCPKIGISQDDYTDSGRLDEWLHFMGATVIYSPITQNVEQLYPKNYGWTEIREGLTAYVDSKQLMELASFATPWDQRTIDVGTRVRYLPPQFGRYGLRKGESAEDFRGLAEAQEFKIDISTSPDDVIYGDDWLRFIGNCKFTLGSKGGSSVNDPYGEIRHRISDYMADHPNAGFAEVEKKCFPDVDGKYIFAGVSPRLFESAALGTCQILIRDEYVGGIEPYVDYIPIEEDLSNIEEVFELMRNEALAKSMIESCYEKLVASRAFDYEAFVAEVLGTFPEGGDVLSTEDAHHVEVHFKTIEAFRKIKTQQSSFFERNWRRTLAKLSYGRSLEHAYAIFDMEPELRSSSAFVKAMFETQPPTLVYEVAADSLATIPPKSKSVSAMKSLMEWAIDSEKGFHDLDVWWDMCEYIYEPVDDLETSASIGTSQ